MGSDGVPLITLLINLPINLLISVPISFPISLLSSAGGHRGPHLCLVTHNEGHLRVHGGWPQVPAGGEGILPDNAAPTHRHLTAEIVPHGHLHRNKVVHITKAVGSRVQGLVSEGIGSRFLQCRCGDQFFSHEVGECECEVGISFNSWLESRPGWARVRN